MYCWESNWSNWLSIDWGNGMMSIIAGTKVDHIQKYQMVPAGANSSCPSHITFPGPAEAWTGFLGQRMFFFTSVYDFYDRICFYIDSLYQSLNMPEDEAVIDHKSSSMFWLSAWSIMALFMQNNGCHPYQLPVWSTGYFLYQSTHNWSTIAHLQAGSMGYLLWDPTWALFHIFVAALKYTI